jgi:hypothetical protein
MQQSDANVLYACWFVPSIVSFLFSAILLIDILRDYKTISFIAVKTALFCLADMIQCSSVTSHIALQLSSHIMCLQFFIAEKFTTSHSICVIQESIFQVGMMFKAVICTISSWILFCVLRNKSSKICWEFVRSPVLLACTCAILTLTVGIVLGGPATICRNMHNNYVLIHPDDGNEVVVWVYMMTFLVPLSLMGVVTAYFGYVAFAGKPCGSYFAVYNIFKIKDEKKESIVSMALQQMIDRLKVYTSIYFLAFMPGIIFALCVGVGYYSLWLFCVIGIISSSTGTLAVTFLFWAPYIDKLRRNNITFALDILAGTSFFMRDSEVTTQTIPLAQLQRESV